MALDGARKAAVFLAWLGPQAAAKLLRLLDQRRNRNPFIYLALGDDSMEQGHFEDAGRFYRKALYYSDEPAEARAALGMRALAQGDLAAARRWLTRAQRADATEPRVEELRERLREAGSGDEEPESSAARGDAAGLGDFRHGLPNDGIADRDLTVVDHLAVDTAARFAAERRHQAAL